MSLHVRMWCVLGGILLGGSHLLAAEEPVKKPAAFSTEKARRKSDTTVAGKQGAPSASNSGRYQMLKAGERVVILDTQTGETRVIEPETPQTLQNVQVGKAWVVVTVLGNASLRSPRVPPAPNQPED